MICKTTKEFQNRVLEHMTFTPHPMGHYTIYKNKEKPKLGFFLNIQGRDIMTLELEIIQYPLTFCFPLIIKKN